MTEIVLAGLASAVSTGIAAWLVFARAASSDRGVILTRLDVLERQVAEHERQSREGFPRLAVAEAEIVLLRQALARIEGKLDRLLEDRA